jgi:hypothetical protein
MHVLDPFIEGSLFEHALALADPTIVVAKNLDPLPGQVTSPEDPWYVGTMSFRRERTNKQQTSNGLFYPVKHSVQVRAGYFEVPGILSQNTGQDVRGHG